MRKTLMTAREETGLSPAEIAKRLNMTERAYRYIEAGKRGTSEENWLKIFGLFEQKYPLDRLMINTAAVELFAAAPGKANL